MADSLYMRPRRIPAPGPMRPCRRRSRPRGTPRSAMPSNALPYYTLGKINSDLNQTDNAITELKQAASLDPKDYLYSYALGIAYFKARRYEDARLPSRPRRRSTRNSKGASKFRRDVESPGRPVEGPRPSARLPSPTRAMAARGRRSAGSKRPRRCEGRRRLRTPRPSSSIPRTRRP